MKNCIVLLIFSAQVWTAIAQNHDIIPPTGPVNGIYDFRIAPKTGKPAFTDLDLVTWIFPDGQYQQKIIHVNGTVLSDDHVFWQPYTAVTNGPIQAFVAKKGGTGNPPSISTATYNFTGSPTATAPATLNYPPGKTWRISGSWDFSPGDENFLVFSYKPLNLGACVPLADGVQLSFDPTQLNLVNSLVFNGESINSSGSVPGLVDLKIKNYIGNSIDKSVFLKFKPLTKQYDLIEVKAIAKVCATAPDTVILRYETAGVPHDPNKKTVNFSSMNLGQPATQLTYSIQFQNDGKAPVDTVKISDLFLPELQSGTFVLADLPAAPGGFMKPLLTTSGATQGILFRGLKLPGLGQTNPAYSYDQTRYRFSFNILSQPNANKHIDNKATITFYDAKGNPLLPPITTNVARVVVNDVAAPACTTLVNLVPNGNFMYGNDKSFQSAWPTPANTCASGSYFVGNQFRSKCSTWPANWFDHTLGTASGSLLLIDGDPLKASTVWTDSVCVVKDRVYTFSFWIKSVYSEAFPLAMMIEGRPVLTTQIAQASPVWQQCTVNWKAPATKCIPIGIRQANKGDKRDFGIDDIFFGFCCECK